MKPRTHERRTAAEEQNSFLPKSFYRNVFDASSVRALAHNLATGFRVYEIKIVQLCIV